MAFICLCLQTWKILFVQCLFQRKSRSSSGLYLVLDLPNFRYLGGSRQIYELACHHKLRMTFFIICFVLLSARIYVIRFIKELWGRLKSLIFFIFSALSPILWLLNMSYRKYNKCQGQREKANQKAVLKNLSCTKIFVVAYNYAQSFCKFLFFQSTL